MSSEVEKPLTVNEWSASFHWVQTPIGLVVDALHLKGSRAVIHTDPFSIDVDRPGTWEAFIEEAALQMFLENRVPDNVREIRTTLVPGEIRVAAKAKILVDIPVEAVCHLRIENQRQIWVDVSSVSLGGAAAKNLLQNQLDKLNPVLDATDLPLNLRFDSVEIRAGELTVYGTVEPKEG